jgi:Ca-activated chloride channel homolog
MRFENQHMLWFLLVFPPLLAAFLWWSWRKRQALMTRFIQARLLPALTVGISPARQKIRFASLIAGVALLILTLARPQWGFSWEETKQKGLDIVVAIDTSKSMLAEDITPNRLARAKLAAMDLMQQAKSDRLGLVAFAGGAFLQCPLTIDDTAFRQSVEALDVNIIPQGGTAIAEAINTALTAFKEGDNYKVLVLLTDGEDNDEGALAAAQAAAKEGMKIFTVGIGTTEGELLRVTDAKGRSDYIRDEQGNVVKSHLNETLLQQIAGETEGGFYLRLAGAKTIDTLYERGLAPLPKSEQSTRLVKSYHEQYHWPLVAAILLLLIEMLLPERRSAGRREQADSLKRAVPQAGAPNLRATAMIVLLFLPGLAFGSPATAWRDYNAKKFTEAQKEYERLAATNKTFDARLVFNAGAAAYRATNYEAATRLFTTALTAPDIKLQQAAYFNLGNTQFRLGQAAKDLDGVQELWETAMKSYQNAVKLNTNDAGAAFNLAFVKNNVEQIIQLREAARRAKESADAATRQRNYHRALEIMEHLVQQNPTAKQFEDYIKKLKDIDAIATPHPDQP